MTGPTRRDLAVRALAHRAAADACERALKDQVRTAYEDEGVATTLRFLNVATVAASIDSNRVVVEDRDALLEYLADRFPTEVVVEEVVVRRVRNEAWLTKLLEGFLPADPPEEMQPGDVSGACDPRGGEIVPGVRWRRGGTYRTASITGDDGLKRALAEAAAEYAATGRLHVLPWLAIDAGPAVPDTSRDDDDSEVAS